MMDDSISRKDLLKKGFVFAGKALGAGVAGGAAYSFLGNRKYKKAFPEIPGNHADLKKNGQSVLILGGGLAGVQAACELADRGFEVTILEKTAHAGGKLKTWKDRRFAKKYFPNGYSREHGLHGVWGFYKNLREFIGRHKIPLNILPDNESFYYLMDAQGVRNKIKAVTWPVPFDRIQMIPNGIYVPSVEDVNKPAPGLGAAFRATMKLSGFDFTNEDQRMYLDSLSFYDWAKKVGVHDQMIRYYYEGMSDMALFLSTRECSALGLGNLIRLGATPADTRVDFYQWPPDETVINPLIKHLEGKGGKILYNTEVTELVMQNGKLNAVKTNQNLPAGSVRRCRVCGNLIYGGIEDHCPYCGADPSMIELLPEQEKIPKTFQADHYILAMDIPGAKKLLINTDLARQHDYFRKIQSLSQATILCVNLLYENSEGWEKRFPSGTPWSAVDFFPTGYKLLGFTSNWSSVQIPGLKQKKVDLIEVQVSRWQEFIGKDFSYIAREVHKELKKVIPDLPDPTDYYINRWDTYTGYRPGDEANRPTVQSPVENLLLIGDWIFVPQHSIFMERTNVCAKWVTNLILEKAGITEGKIEILESGTPDWQLSLLGLLTSVKA
ncbi:MAG: FAD-dependent oxidoreductase [Spirochaetia bacterium]|nr:FAD-dependent oxidoreductase [Spirochaetia bacterium]